MGKFLIITGIVLVVAGIVIFFMDKLPIKRIPGDFVIKRENFTIYFPLGTSILISILLTLILYFIRK